MINIQCAMYKTFIQKPKKMWRKNNLHLFSNVCFLLFLCFFLNPGWRDQAKKVTSKRYIQGINRNYYEGNKSIVKRRGKKGKRKERYPVWFKSNQRKYEKESRRLWEAGQSIDYLNTHMPTFHENTHSTGSFHHWAGFWIQCILYKRWVIYVELWRLIVFSFK